MYLSMRSIMFKLSAAALAVAVSMAAPPAQPHIVIFIVDDFGWANIGIHRNVTNDPRHEVQTPNMDALAATGLTLDRNYLFWYCSPSRSALQTGRNPIHVNVDNSDMRQYNPADPVGGFEGIPRNMTGIGSKLQAAGYSTNFFGKWHVGIATPDHTPRGRGWDNSLIYFDGANDYWTSTAGACGKRNGGSITDLWVTNASYEGPALGQNNSWSCSQANQPSSCVYEDAMFLNEMLASIDGADPTTPYFAIWAPHNIHAPLQVPDAYKQKFSFIDWPERQLYAAKVNYIDDALGQVLQKLQSKGMWNNTLFILTADNGGPIYQNGSAGANNWPLKGGKTSNWEGGVRGNGIVSGGLLPPARRGVVEEAFVQIEDWYPTICGLAGVNVTDERAAAAGLWPVEGVDLWPLLSGTNTTPPRTEVVLGMPTLSSGNSIGDPYVGVQAVIDSEGYKLIIGYTHENVWTSPTYPNQSTSWPNYANDCTAGCLYNVFTDPTEHFEISAANPDKVASLRARIAYWNSTMYRPDRGNADPAACEAALSTWQGFWGPFVA